MDRSIKNKVFHIKLKEELNVHLVWKFSIERNTFTASVSSDVNGLEKEQ